MLAAARSKLAEVDRRQQELAEVRRRLEDLADLCGNAAAGTDADCIALRTAI